jgi:hypothetical protein
MPQKEIIVKTDASTQVGEGCGVGYVASIYRDGSKPTEVSNSHFIEKDYSTTDSETIAVMYSLIDIYQKIYQPNNYKIVIETDCEPTVRRVDKTNPYEMNIDDVIDHYKKLFDGFQIRWIPRSTNQDADDLAWIEFQRNVTND